MTAAGRPPQALGPVPPKKPVAWYWWPYWAVLLTVGLTIFYVILTPVWMGIRLVAWLSERGNR